MPCCNAALRSRFQSGLAGARHGISELSFIELRLEILGSPHNEDDDNNNNNNNKMISKNKVAS
jgi:hypothetical protein